jgi:Tol biopolymer transport system component
VGDDIRSTLITANADGTARSEANTLFPPFYLYWSPDDSKVAYLSNWLDNSGPTIALHIADLTTTEGAAAPTATDVNPVGAGQPFYFSWAPTSDRLLAHVDDQEVLLLDLATQEPTVLDENSTNFAAPQWVAAAGEEGSLLYVIQDAQSSQLVRSDAGGENTEFLAYLTYDDFISFGMNATGERIAYIETTEQVGFNAFGPLFIYDLAVESFQQISTDPAIAFFWSPDGAALYFLTVEIAAERVWLRVNVWDGATVQQFARFMPSVTFARDYLPFADQYRQSMRFWAPDSSAVVYAGQAEDGTTGVWVQSMAEDAAPRLVTAGVFATWSPR